MSQGAVFGEHRCQQGFSDLTDAFAVDRKLPADFFRFEVGVHTDAVTTISITVPGVGNSNTATQARTGKGSAKQRT